MKKWYIGCSGFHYKPWKGPFYPESIPQRKWFESYCEHFNTVELNVTFYRFPKVDFLKSYYQRSPAEFTFTLKAPRRITHYKRFKNVHDEINYFYDTASDGLQNKLGTILFQLHPQIQYSEDTLERITQALNPGFRNVLEFRHESWWNKDVQNKLEQEKIVFCGISYPGLPEDVMKTSSTMYYRFHGVPELYRSAYSDKDLQNVLVQIQTCNNAHDVYIYFNNDIDVAAVYNAKTLQRMLR